MEHTLIIREVDNNGKVWRTVEEKKHPNRVEALKEFQKVVTASFWTVDSLKVRVVDKNFNIVASFEIIGE